MSNWWNLVTITPLLPIPDDEIVLPLYTFNKHGKKGVSVEVPPITVKTSICQENAQIKKVSGNILVFHLRTHNDNLYIPVLTTTVLYHGWGIGGDLLVV